MTTQETFSVTRRDFVKATGAAMAASPALMGATSRTAAETLNVGVIGCGGRGTGAARDALMASENARIVAMADVFPDRLESSRGALSGFGERGTAAKRRCTSGFDAYRSVLDTDVDVVILATPPHFRPAQFEAAVRAGKHVFMEKPVAVDPAGIRRVIAAAEEADRRGLSVVAGTQRRHEASYLAAMGQVHDGAIGEIVAARCYWNMGGLWSKKHRAEWTDMEWQLRNWLYFTWLSGDHIVEQHVHNLDVVAWAIGAHPVRALGLGGRQARTQPVYGNIFDHFAIEYEYPDGQFLMSMCRQQDGCPSRVEEVILGDAGRLVTRPSHAVVTGARPWRFEADNPSPYVQEHRDLHASIRGSGPRLNEGRQVAESTLTAIMGRMSAYTGQEVTWEQAMNSTLDLTPPAYEFGPMPMPPVAVPGKTPLV
ncbi:MAG: Gfo/Idh/MocA family oxidoreductase [Planctomycetes bacterium]|nr:Gfo/Idh/MocA family oxidoreductase [Planctomycetota bacterium]